MTQYIHHIPGRLRLKFEQLKRRSDLAQAAEAAIRKIEGVTLVEARVITGSLLIRYDAAVLGRDRLFLSLENVFQSVGLRWMHSLASNAQSAQSTRAAQADFLADKLVGMMVEKCLERSAVMLLGALL